MFLVSLSQHFSKSVMAPPCISPEEVFFLEGGGGWQFGGASDVIVRQMNMFAQMYINVLLAILPLKGLNYMSS